MSWEGYYQHLCPVGHQFTSGPDYAGEDPDLLCPDCHKPPVQSNTVDETNGCDYYQGREGQVCSCGRRELVIVTPPVVERCSLGFGHETVPATYRFGETHRIKERE